MGVASVNEPDAGGWRDVVAVDWRAGCKGVNPEHDLYVPVYRDLFLLGCTVILFPSVSEPYKYILRCSRPSKLYDSKDCPSKLISSRMLLRLVFEMSPGLHTDCETRFVAAYD